MKHRSQIPLKIMLDGQPVRSETLATSVGAYILVLETALPGQAIDLHSIYTGHANTKTQATHLILAPRPAGSNDSRTRERRDASHARTTTMSI